MLAPPVDVPAPLVLVVDCVVLLPAPPAPVLVPDPVAVVVPVPEPLVAEPVAVPVPEPPVPAPVAVPDPPPEVALPVDDAPAEPVRRRELLLSSPPQRQSATEPMPTRTNACRMLSMLWDLHLF